MKANIFLAAIAALVGSPALALTTITIEGLLTLNRGTGSLSNFAPRSEIVKYTLQISDLIEPGFSGSINFTRFDAKYSVFGVSSGCACAYSGGVLIYDRGRLNDFGFAQWDLDESNNFRPGGFSQARLFIATGRVSGRITGRFDWFRDTTPVPEISTWASMIVGFGVVGASRRMRRARTAPKAG